MPLSATKLVDEYNSPVITLPNSSKRVAIRIQGGLGNQMFQLALGIALKKSNNVDIDYIQIDEPILKRQKITHRRLEIRKFSSAEKLRVHKLKSLILKRSFEDALKSFYVGKSCEIFTEKQILAKDIQNRTAEVVGLDGYWQSEAFFRNAKEEVVEAFGSLSKMGSTYRGLENIVSQQTTIGVHVRRGDYITNVKTNNFHGACSLKYYQSALGIILKNFETSSVFLFSDDPAWAEKNLGGPKRLVISSQYGLSVPEELKLLSKCSHLVLSNSSFSWWSAFLRENSLGPSPMVIVPEPWFAGIKLASPRLPHWHPLHIETGSNV
jgi:hypothetical protein